MHTIHDIAFEVDVQTNQFMNSWEQYYANFVQERLLPNVERVFDQWKAKHPNTKCTIESLAITVDVDDLDLERIQKEIMQQLQQQLLEIQEDGRDYNGKVIAEFTREASPFEALLHYLSSGFLPKNMPVKSFKEWLGSLNEFSLEEQSTLTKLFSKDRSSIARMLSLFRNNHEKFFTVVKTAQKIHSQYVQLEESFFHAYVQTLFKAVHISYSKEQATIWFQTLQNSNSLHQFTLILLQLLTPKVATESKKMLLHDEKEVLLSLIHAIVQYEIDHTIQLATVQKGIALGRSISPHETNPSDHSRTNNSKEKRSKEQTESEFKTQESNEKSETNASLEKKETNAAEHSQKTTKKNTQKTTVNGENRSLEANEITEKPTENQQKSKQLANEAYANKLTDSLLTTEKSGLVLLNPFLTTFFKAANVVSEENVLENPERACVLLHYLATENEEVTDVELSLEKALLGIPQDEVMNCQESLTDHDKKMCVELLEAVLEHWVVLKKSTINTLRDMFIKRDGELKFTKDHIHLKVERAAQDILLEKIPWNISLIRLKWMEKMMHIEW